MSPPRDIPSRGGYLWIIIPSAIQLSDYDHRLILDQGATV
jgi:hypothetical protein